MRGGSLFDFMMSFKKKLCQKGWDNERPIEPGGNMARSLVLHVALKHTYGTL